MFGAGLLDQDAAAGRLMIGSSPIGGMVSSVHLAGAWDGPLVVLFEEQRAVRRTEAMRSLGQARIELRLAQRARSEAIASFGAPKAGQVRDSSSHPEQERLNPEQRQASLRSGGTPLEKC
jgi:hypothetical protein